MDIDKFVAPKPDKYDAAIDYLTALDAGRGSYFGEIAELIQELLGRVYELEEQLAAVDDDADEDE
jgi:hypothetical protein